MEFDISYPIVGFTALLMFLVCLWDHKENKTLPRTPVKRCEACGHGKREGRFFYCKGKQLGNAPKECSEATTQNQEGEGK